MQIDSDDRDLRHSCASKMEAMLVAAMKPGSSRWPPEAQFSRMMPRT